MIDPRNYPNPEDFAHLLGKCLWRLTSCAWKHLRQIHSPTWWPKAALRGLLKGAEASTYNNRVQTNTDSKHCRQSWKHEQMKATLPNKWLQPLSGLSKTMVCQTYGLHAGLLSRKQQIARNDEDNSDNYKQRVECRKLAEIMETTEMRQSGCIPRVPQTTGLEILTT